MHIIHPERHNICMTIININQYGSRHIGN